MSIVTKMYCDECGKEISPGKEKWYSRRLGEYCESPVRDECYDLVSDKIFCPDCEGARGSVMKVILELPKADVHKILDFMKENGMKPKVE